MKRLHGLLQRQITDLFAKDAPIEPHCDFVEAVNQAYLAADKERLRIEQAFNAKTEELSRATVGMREVLSAIPDLLFRVNADDTVDDLRHSDAAQSDDVLYQLTDVSDDANASIARQFADCLRCVRESQVTSCFIIESSTTAHDVYYEVRLVPMANRQIIGIARDVTAQKEAEAERELAEERLRLQAYHDPLTGLPNRALFQLSLDKAIAEAERTDEQFAVLFLDLDRFKHVNDLLGHSVGDMLLQEVAARLTHRIHEDDILARMGGDEFTVLIPRITHADQAEETARRLLEALDPPFELADHELFVPGSIGISIFPSAGRAGQLLLQHADIAMYRTKARGGHGFSLYADGTDAKTTERLKLETSLRRALDHGEFLVHYQPLVSISDSAIIGFEALVRWNHPEYGMVAPAKFIQLTEETGLIMKLGEWVLRKACGQAAIWEAQGHPMRIAVNLSARQFDTSGLSALVSDALDEAALSPHLLELEITEGTVLNHDQSTIDTLNALRGIGVRLSIDDFGTGYSSLSQLRHLPFDVLKIDRSFLREVAGGATNLELHDQIRPHRLPCQAIAEPTQHSIIRAIVEIAHALGLEIIAEGVETEEQRALVEALGCDIVQGYFYSRPLPAEEIDRLLQSHSDRVLLKAA